MESKLVAAAFVVPMGTERLSPNTTLSSCGSVEWYPWYPAE